MMHDLKTTAAKVFVDGFGGMALTNINDTHKDVIQYLNDESIWEVFDGAERLERHEYLITLNFWWEDNFPEAGGEFCTEVINTVKVD